jgi:hypothetical protein
MGKLNMNEVELRHKFENFQAFLLRDTDFMQIVVDDLKFFLVKCRDVFMGIEGD